MIRYEDLKILFDQRPSRIEDIETIKMLKKEIMVREDEIKKLHEHMKFFKLELINREQNYNKIFNANPHIGVLNPLENKVIILIIYVYKKYNFGLFLIYDNFLGFLNFRLHLSQIMLIVQIIQTLILVQAMAHICKD